MQILQQCYAFFTIGGDSLIMVKFVRKPIDHRTRARSRDPPPSLAATHWRGNCRTYGPKSSVGSSIRDLPGALALRTAPGRTETGLQARKANPGKGRLCRASPAGTATLITMTF